MEEREFTFFRNATIAIIIILMLLFIAVSGILLFATGTKSYSAPQADSSYATTTSSYQPTAQQQLSSLYQQPTQQETPTTSYQTDNMNVPPCVEPCKVRVEYANKYFLPYPRYSYGYQYYRPYPAYPYRYYRPYPSYGQRFFHYRIIQRDYTY